MKALLFLLLLVISNGFSEEDQDYCNGKDGNCDEGYHWLSKAWLAQNFPHDERPTGECAPCKTNEKTVVVPAEKAPEWLLQNNDWTKEPWTETDPDLNFYGILWANASFGELFATGYCRFQRSWQKHRTCDIATTMMGLETPKHDPKTISLFSGLVQISYKSMIYDVVDERMVEFIGTVDQWWGLGYLTGFFRNVQGIFCYTTIEDVKKEPHAWTQHWKNVACHTDKNGEKICGFTGPYYMIIDSNGKKTKYFEDYLKYSKGRLYTWDRAFNTAAVDIDTRVFIWKIIIAIIFGSLGALIYYLVIKKNVLLPAPIGLGMQAPGGEQILHASDENDCCENDCCKNDCCKKNCCEKDCYKKACQIKCRDCPTMSWVFFVILASILPFMAKDIYPRAPVEGSGCGFENDYGGLGFFYFLYYLVAIVLGFYNLKKMLPFGCCCCIKPKSETCCCGGIKIDAVELSTVKEAKSELVQWIWSPMMFVIIIAHSGMVYARMGAKKNIGTPVKLIICTLGQLWTLSWIQFYIGNSKQEYRKSLKMFMQWVIFVMILRVFSFAFSSDPGAAYFAIGAQCQRFLSAPLVGAIIASVVAGYIVSQNNQKNPMLKISNCSEVCCYFSCCPVVLLLLVAGFANVGQNFVNTQLDLCKDSDCTTISIDDIGLKTALAYSLVSMQTIGALVEGNPNATEAIKKPYLVGGRIVYPIRQSISGIRSSPTDEDNGPSTINSMITKAVFGFLNGLTCTVDTTVMSDAHKEAWQAHFEQKWPCGAEKCEVVPSWSYKLDTSDETINQFAFSGLAAHRLAPVTDQSEIQEIQSRMKTILGKDVTVVHKIDCSALEGLAYADGFQPMGGIAYYDNTSNVICIKYRGVVYNPKHVDWKWIKWVFRSSVFLLVTAVDHLVGAHMLVSGRYTLASEQFLLPEHPVRIFMKPFTHHSQEINWQAGNALFPEYGLLRDATGLTSEGFDDVINLAAAFVRERAYNTAHEQREMLHTLYEQNNNYTFGEDATSYIDIIENYTTTFVNAHYKNDDFVKEDKGLGMFWYAANQRSIPLTKESLKDLLTYFIFTVTAYHQQVGFVGQVMKNPDIAGWKIIQNEIGPSLQAAYQVMVIALATGTRQVLLLDYEPESIIPQTDPNRDLMVKAWGTFVKKMKKLDKVIKKKNKHRRFPCESMLPTMQGISIGV